MKQRSQAIAESLHDLNEHVEALREVVADLSGEGVNTEALAIAVADLDRYRIAAEHHRSENDRLEKESDMDEPRICDECGTAHHTSKCQRCEGEYQAGVNDAKRYQENRHWLGEEAAEALEIEQEMRGLDW